MSIKKIILSIAISAIVIKAPAQKKYSEGIITYDMQLNGQDIEAKCYFKDDSSSFSYQQGPAKVVSIGTANNDFYAVLVEIPVANIKNACIATPAELEQSIDMIPEYNYTATTETKKIGDFNCKKIIATEKKTNRQYELWITTDIILPVNTISKYYAGLTGTPIQFTIMQEGMGMITLKSVSYEKIPDNTFKIPSDFVKSDLKSLRRMGK